LKLLCHNGSGCVLLTPNKRYLINFQKNRIMNKIYGLVTAILVSVSPALSQPLFTGKIYDNETKEPLIGASVLIPGTLTGVSTDLNGHFSIPFSVSDSVEVRYLGYVNQRFKLHPGGVNHLALASSPNNVQEIIITGSRENQTRSEVPMAINKISASMINETKPVLLVELMNKVPGVAMLNLNNEQHGMGIRLPMGTSNYFLYMEDGIPLRPMGVFNHNALIETNLFSLSGIEVVKGPASSLYGPEAVGGAINFITQKPTSVLTAKAGIQFDNYGYRRVQYGSGAMITQKLGYYIGGYNAIQRNGWMSNSDYDKNSINARLDYDLTNRTKLILATAFNDYVSETGPGVDSVAFYSRQYLSPTDFTYRKVRSLRARLSLEQKWNENHNTSVHVFYRDNTIEQNPAYAIRWITGKKTATGQINRNSLSSRGVIAQHVVRLNALKTKVIAGLSLDHSPNVYKANQIDLNAELRSNGLSVEKYTIAQIRDDIMLADYSAIILNYAAYTQLEIKPVKKLCVTLGARYDVMTFDYKNYLDGSSGTKSVGQFSPKIGVTYQLFDAMGLYANYAKGFAPPGLTSIFTKNPNSESGFYYDLAPAQFTNYELGSWMTLFKDKLKIDISFYLLNGKNELLNVRQPDNSTDYQSAGKTSHKGIEYGVTVKPYEALMVRLSCTHATHRFEEFVLSTKPTDLVKDVNGKYMPSAPSCIMNSEIIYKPQFVKGIRAGLEWQYMSSWYQDQINNFKYQDPGAFGLQGISVVNFRMGYQWKGVEVFANVMNLTDELYAFNATRGNYSSSRTTYTPAPPRTYVFGLQYNFTSKK
jgi:outer membrane receptor protein involved in Fe transport